MFRKILLIMTLSAFFLITGCANTGTPKSSMPPVVINPSPAVTPIIPKINPAPTEIDVIESYAEDVMDDIDKKDWSKVQGRIDTLKTNMTALAPSLTSEHVPVTLIDGLNSAISNFEKQVANKNVYNAKVAANQITKYIPDIMDTFQTILPTDLGRIDYLGREIKLNVEKNDWDSAGNNGEKIKLAWGNLKTKLDSTYSNDSAKFNVSVDNLIKYIGNRNSKLTTAEATTLLDLTDVLEADFAKQFKK